MNRYFGTVLLLTMTLFASVQAAQSQTDLDYLKSRIVYHEDFPQPGILFQDFFPLLADGQALGMCIELLAQRYEGQNIEAVVGMESRGFIIGAALAYRLGVGFVPLRKPGKLPGTVYTADYGKEYGKDRLCLSTVALTSGQRVLLVDDLIATGGTALAAIDLVRQAGAEPVEFVTILEVKGLGGRERLGIPSFNLLD